MVQCFGSAHVSENSNILKGTGFTGVTVPVTGPVTDPNEFYLHFARSRLDQIGPLFYRFSVDPKQKLADYSRRGIFSDGQLFPKHVTRVFPSELEPASHHTKKLKWESILAMNQDLGFCSKIFEKLL